MKVTIEVKCTQEALKYLMQVLSLLQHMKLVTFFRKLKEE